MLDRDVYVIVPAYREAAALEAALRPVIALPVSVVVVDDGSPDDTYAVARRLPVHRLRHAVNLGQGAALETGTRYALARGARAVIHFDADGQHGAEALEALLAPLEAGRADMTTGSRFLRASDAEAVPRARRLLLRLARIVNGLLTGVWLTDAHNGLRALTREAASRVRIRENRQAHASEILWEARRQGLRVEEVPVHVRYTDYSRAKGQRASAGLDILVDLILRRVL